MTEEVRVGRIDFVNSDPVYHGLETGEVEGDIRLVNGFPTALNSMLARGDLDVAPVSSIEYARNPDDYYLLPNLSVSSESEVGSILLFTRRPPDELGGSTVALASTSATSVVLLKILLREKYGVDPEYVVREPDAWEMLDEEGVEAALVIGDHALEAHKKGVEGAMAYDLGKVWRDYTGERMVYAVWAVRNDVPRDDARHVAEVLEKSKKVGYDNLDAIAHRLGDRMGLDEGYAEEYLRMLDHDLTPEHVRGLTKYYEAAERIGELEAVPGIPLEKP